MNKFVVGLVKFARILVRPFFPVKIYGDRKVENKKCLVVGNHVSGWDPVIYIMWMKNIVSFVYKAEFSKSKFLTWVFKGLDCIPIRRGEVDINASKCILRLLKDDKSVCLFPEGTRNPNIDCLQEFKTGAALFALKTKSPIRPFYIWDKAKAFRRNYIVIGEEFTLSEFYDQPISRKTLEAATEVIRNKVDELRVQLNETLAAKGVKRRPRTRKEIEKIMAYNDRQRTLAKQLAEQSANAEQNGQPSDVDSKSEE
ncbi:MAG: 1-acyl-sn-glycerol-3-phosphate acyltransferase [Clostridiales bacterium]|nr:1-acyl-sn-glycerol-3-phosphate acyltransferase [Clostridiales bacterium]